MALDILTCPKCSSTNVTYHYSKSKIILPTGCDIWCHSCDYMWLWEHAVLPRGDKEATWLEITVSVLGIGLFIFFIYSIGGF